MFFSMSRLSYLVKENYERNLEICFLWITCEWNETIDVISEVSLTFRNVDGIQIREFE